MHQAQPPRRTQNVESRSRGSPPLPPQPAGACKPPKAAGKLFQSSSAPGIAAVPHRAEHRPCRRAGWCPGHGWRSRRGHRRRAPASLRGEGSGAFPTPVVLGVGISPSFLGAGSSKAQDAQAGGCAHTCTSARPPGGENKQKMGYSGARYI